ncbi:MAG TPA: adenylyl-sulfate kinase, partial [Roseiflexaceae bacterium]|nr:adenylyl-sulfate kinase [Roseiflexaceae bacterium]
PNATYAPAERDWFYNRLVELAVWLARAGEHVLITATGSRRCYREAARAQLGPRFAEVWVRWPVDICHARDQKEPYDQAAAGAIRGLPGADMPYEAPEAPDLMVDTAQLTPEEAAEIILTGLGFLESTAIMST